MKSLKTLTYQQRPDVASGTYMFLGQAIIWIICRGQAGNTGDIAERWEDAEGQLFEALDSHDAVVEGYQARSRVYQPLPKGIWARMNKGDWDDPKFFPIDDSEAREDGGNVLIGSIKWDGVRLPAAFVLKHWPPTSVSPAPTKAVGRRPRYDWAAFDKVALAKLDEEGAFDPSVDTQWNKAALERHMAAWCQGNWGVEPSESTIRSKLTEVEAAYLEGRKGR